METLRRGADRSIREPVVAPKPLAAVVGAREAAEPRLKVTDIPSLDGIRAAAIGLVFAAHVGLARLPGNFGVTAFFFLSGYLITTLLRAEHERTGSISLRSFYLRRFFRIMPPFYLVLAGASLLTASRLLAGSLDPVAVGAQVLHLSNYYVIAHGWWSGRAPGTWIYWSLAVEEHFYLAFPVLYIVMRRYLQSGRDQFLLLGLLCVAVLAWRFVLVLHGSSADRTYLATDTRIDSILFGCMLAVFANPVLDGGGTPRRSLLLPVYVPLAILGLLISFVVTDGRFEQTLRYTLQGVCLFPLFIAAIRHHDWGPFRLLNLRFVRFIGALSFTLYLVHPTVIYLVSDRIANKYVAAVASIAVAMSICTVLHYAVERPFGRLRRHLSKLSSVAELQPRQVQL